MKSPKSIFFRTDASPEVGTGHVMRCLALAKTLRKHGAKVAFICRATEGNLNAWLKETHDFTVWAIEPDEDDAESTLAILEAQESKPDWLVVDHYGIDETWEKQVRPAVVEIAVIDDLANRKHDCEVLIDQNYHPDLDRYHPLTPLHCAWLLGTGFALLRDEFAVARKHALPRGFTLRNILVSFGGSDPTNETEKVLKALSKIVADPAAPEFSATIILGMLNPHAKVLTEQYAHPRFTFLQAVDNMAELLSRADLVIGAGGTSSWERCCVGASAMVIGIAENQVALSQHLYDTGGIEYLGYHNAVDVDKIEAAVRVILKHTEKVHRMSLISWQLVDGRGTERIAGYLLTEVERATLDTRPRDAEEAYAAMQEAAGVEPVDPDAVAAEKPEKPARRTDGPVDVPWLRHR